MLGHASDESTRHRTRLARVPQLRAGEEIQEQWVQEVAGRPQSRSQKLLCARSSRSSDHWRGCFLDKDSSLGRIAGGWKAGLLPFGRAMDV